MTGLIVVAVVLLLILVLLMASLKINLYLNTEAYFEVKYLGITVYRLTPEKEESPKRKKQTALKKEDKQGRGFKELLKSYSNGKPKKELISEFFVLIKRFLISFKQFIRHIYCDDIYLDLTVASDEAGKTAILYGSLCGIVSSITSMLEAAKNFNINNISVKTDFTAEKISLNLGCAVRVRLLYILAFGLSAAFSILKIKIGDMKNVRA